MSTFLDEEAQIPSPDMGIRKSLDELLRYTHDDDRTDIAFPSTQFQKNHSGSLRKRETDDRRVSQFDFLARWIQAMGVLHCLEFSVSLYGSQL